MNKNYFLTCMLCALAAFGIAPSWAQVTTFSYTGAADTYTVPLGVTSIQIEAWGAQGGGSKPCSGPLEDDGGLGGYAIGNLAVTPGEVLTVYVGQKPTTLEGGGVGPGGFNGGGDCGQWAGGGGGASDVRQDGVALTDRVVVAGGGGGGNAGCPHHGAGGDGGGLTGVDGTIGSGFVAGTGGTAVAGGIGGGSGTDGALGVGGTGGYHVAGGGGGYYGGGGAYAAGAGGGSSFLGGLTDASTSAGIRTGNGEIIITILCTPITVTVSDYEICLGDEITLDGDADSGADVDWDGGAIDGEPFTPGESGVITYTASTEDGGDCNFSVDITVYEAPIVVAGSGDENYCDGELVVLSAGGNADDYDWTPTDLDPGIGTHTYVLTGTTDVGCEATDEVEVTVHALPTVSASVDLDEVCEGNTVVLTGSGADDYAWDPADIVDGEAYNPGGVGTYSYTVVGTDENGCEDDATVSVTVVEGITITYTVIDEIVFEDGEIDITVTGGVAPYTFDWDIDGTGDFDDDEDLTGLADAFYTVVVNGSTGCSTSETIGVGRQASVEELAASLISVYPNPTSENVTIAFDGTFSYELSAINGDILFSGSAVDNVIVNMNDFATGVYFVTVKSEGAVNTIKLIKK